MKNISAEEALAIWKNDGHLSAAKVDELKKSLKEKGGDIGVSKGIAIFATIGAILVGLGVLLFIGSNWSEMSPFHRILVIAMGYGVVVLAAIVTGNRGLSKVSEALWLLVCLLLGANIFLLGQIFHFSLTFWQGPFLWMIGVLAVGFARRQKEYGALAVPLGLLALGWVGGGKGWFMDDQMQFLIDEGGLRPILPLIGVGLISLSLLIRTHSDWLEDALMNWGAFLLAVPLIITTIDPEVLSFFQMEYTVKQMIIIAATLFLVALAFVKGDIRSKESRYALLTVAALQVFFVIQRYEKALVDILVSDNDVAFFFYVLVVFGLSLLATWSGVQAGNRSLINAGVLSTSIIILIQYFSWTYDMLHSSIAFIMGGIVLITLSIFMERTRRKLLESIPNV